MPRLQTNMCALLGGSSRFKTRPRTVNAHSATEAVLDEAAHRLVSMLTHPRPQRWVPYSRSVVAKRLMWGQPAVTPRHRRRGRDHRENVLRPADVLANEAHHTFTKGQWRRARFLNQPEVKLTMSVNALDYQAFRVQK